MNLTNDQLKHLRSLLEDEMDTIRNRLDANDAYQTKESEETMTSELSHYDNHPGDLGSELFERGKDLALRDSDSIHLHEISDALERMDDGEYGTCQACGKDIPYERLEAVPASSYCVHCQENADEREISANRPVEENFLFPGFGRTFMDDQDQTGFDGEDAWQAVARYGPAVGNDDNPYATHPNDMYIDSDERVGYVEDLEGFIITDMAGNPVEDPQFVRNQAYYREMHAEERKEDF